MGNKHRRLEQTTESESIFKVKVRGKDLINPPRQVTEHCSVYIQPGVIPSHLDCGTRFSMEYVDPHNGTKSRYWVAVQCQKPNKTIVRIGDRIQ